MYTVGPEPIKGTTLRAVVSREAQVAVTFSGHMITVAVHTLAFLLAIMAEHAVWAYVFAELSSVTRRTLAFTRSLVTPRSVLALAQPSTVQPVTIFGTPLTAGGPHVAVSTVTRAGGHVTSTVVVALTHAVTVRAVLAFLAPFQLIP